MGGAKSVLDASQHAEPSIRVALQVEHDVDHVLEDFRAGEASILGHVADKHDDYPCGLGETYQTSGALSHLSHPSRCGRDLGNTH